MPGVGHALAAPTRLRRCDRRRHGRPWRLPPGRRRGGRAERRASRLGRGTVSGADVAPGVWPLAQPLRVGPRFIRAKLYTSGQGVSEHERGGGLEFAAEQIGGAGRLEAQGPPVLATGADLGEFCLASRLLAQPWGARLTLSAGQGEPADAPPLAYRPPAAGWRCRGGAGYRERTTSARTPSARGRVPPPPGSPGCRGTPSPPMPRPRGPLPTARATADLAGRCPGVIPSGPGNRPNDPATAVSSWPGKIQRTSRLRTASVTGLRRFSRHRHMLLTLADGCSITKPRVRSPSRIMVSPSLEGV